LSKKAQLIYQRKATGIVMGLIAQLRTTLASDTNSKTVKVRLSYNRVVSDTKDELQA